MADFDFEIEIDEKPAKKVAELPGVKESTELLAPAVKPAAPQLPIEIDLATVVPEKRALMLARAEMGGITVRNAHLVDQAPTSSKQERRALLMEFPENPPPEVVGMRPLFRMTRRNDLDLLFTGLPVGSIFQDRLEDAVKEKHTKGLSATEAMAKHFVVYVYMAIALPYSDDGSSGDGWGATIFCPKEFERVIPKALRVHLGIDLWFKHSDSRFDAIWYKVAEVASEEQQDEAIRIAKRTARIAWAIHTLGAPKPEIPPQSIQQWENEYFAKHPEELQQYDGVAEYVRQQQEGDELGPDGGSFELVEKSVEKPVDDSPKLYPFPKTTIKDLF